MDDKVNTTNSVGVFHIPDDHGKIEKTSLVFIKVMLVMYWVSIILILVGNVTVIVMVIKNKILHTVTNMYIVSLCVSDITVGAFSIPADIMSIYNEYITSDAMCKVLEYVSYVALCSNIYGVLCISVDRYRVTVKPFFKNKSKRQGMLLIAMVWTFSCIYAVRAVFWYRMQTTSYFDDGTWSSESYCVISPTQAIRPVMQGFIIVDLFLVYLLPLTVMTILHVIILRKAYRSSDKVVSSAYKNRHSLKRKIKMIRMLVLITIIFGLCQLPENIYMVVRYFSGDFAGAFQVKHICDLILFSNSWLNVVAYVMFNENFRKIIFRKGNIVGTMTVRGSKTINNEDTGKPKTNDCLSESKDVLSPTFVLSGNTQSTSALKSSKSEPQIFVIAEVNNK